MHEKVNVRTTATYYLTVFQGGNLDMSFTLIPISCEPKKAIKKICILCIIKTTHRNAGLRRKLCYKECLGCSKGG